MTVPKRLEAYYLPIKLFLSSYRALSDGRIGISHLESLTSEAKLYISDWKVIWLGTCTILRTAVDLFRRDSGACIPNAIRLELKREWMDIKNNPEQHEIFWKFLRCERDMLIHEYEWRAYEAWIDPDGIVKPASITGLWIGGGQARAALLMRDGPFKGQDTLSLLAQSATWIEDRIISAIRRAGYDPDEERSLGSFAPKLAVSSESDGTLLASQLLRF